MADLSSNLPRFLFAVELLLPSSTATDKDRPRLSRGTDHLKATGRLLDSTEVRLLDNTVDRDSMAAAVEAEEVDMEEDMEAQRTERLLHTRTCPSTVVHRESRPATVSDEKASQSAKESRRLAARPALFAPSAPQANSISTRR